MGDLFDNQHIPLTDQIACVEREIAMREKVYPRRVAANRMTQQTADLQLRQMDAVLATLRHLNMDRDRYGGYDDG